MSSHEGGDGRIGRRVQGREGVSMLPLLHVERICLIWSRRQASEELLHSVRNLGFPLHHLFFFLMWTIFISLSGIRYSFASVFSLGFFGHKAAGSWLPDRGSNPHPLHWVVTA